MSDFIVEQFKDELNPGETIEWCGKPQQRLFFEKEDFTYLIPNLIFSIFVFYLLSKLFLRNTYFLSTFIFIGLALFLTYPLIFMLIGKLFIGPIRRSKTAYAVTNQRIIIFSGISKRNIKSVTLDALNDMSVSIRKNGKGTIRLGNSIGTPWNSRYTGHQYYLVERSIYVPEFEMIEDVKMVYDLIKKLKNEKKSD